MPTNIDSMPPLDDGARPRPPRRGGARTSWVAGAAMVALIAASCSSADPASKGLGSQGPSSSVREVAGASGYDPKIDPRDFVARVDNALFSLEPGTVFRLRGATEDGIERETITVTNQTKEILGVTTTVVKDVVRVNGRVHESTFDWYAQDRDGNVWYFGEGTAE